MNTHKNAPLTPEGRERMVRAVVDDGKNDRAVVVIGQLICRENVLA